jgi:hypothetical protein
MVLFEYTFPGWPVTLMGEAGDGGSFHFPLRPAVRVR